MRCRNGWSDTAAVSDIDGRELSHSAACSCASFKHWAAEVSGRAERAHALPCCWRAATSATLTEQSTQPMPMPAIRALTRADEPDAAKECHVCCTNQSRPYDFGDRVGVWNIERCSARRR